ncbi:MAG TPA: hypothetical protein VFD92_13345 [Candidatus Binatia bacterium]|nr:hypothetical protein [Candidatus Binatia bacterium]
MDAMKESRTRALLRGAARSRAMFPLACAIAAWGAAASAPAATPSVPANEAARETVVVGEVVETACFVMAGRRGENHRQCGVACARAGQPLAILDDKAGTLYVAVFDRSEGTPDNPLLGMVSERVEVRGIPLERGGVNAILVKRARSLNPPAD